MPRSHQMTDIASQLDEAALGRVLEFALLLVDAIDAALEPESDRAQEPATPA